MSDHLTTDRPFFFVHIMKTAGMTFNAHIANNFARDAVYPGEDDTTGVDYWVINNLRAATARPRPDIRLWHGHFPFFVTEFVPDAITLAVMREPVARTVSLLNQQRVQNHPDRTIEELYDDALINQRMVGEHQTRMFAMSNSDGINAWTQPFAVDDAAFELAKQRVGSVDLLGFQEDFDGFLAALHDRWNWRIDRLDDRNTATEAIEIDDAFRARIVADNPYDMALYEFARALG
ncbi:MAG: hypothetical protein DHS20C19_05310 [Acidimicrobiales bacterium]|nr:MAG: hypothetical protein DHS20C19_05310 [Acidimicrobiales bacterium]